jgi:Bacterial protein of unknown function (DUF899)
MARLNQRDVTMVCVSRAPLAKINAYKRRLGWRFPTTSTRPTGTVRTRLGEGAADLRPRPDPHEVPAGLDLGDRVLGPAPRRRTASGRSPASPSSSARTTRWRSPDGTSGCNSPDQPTDGSIAASSLRCHGSRWASARPPSSLTAGSSASMSTPNVRSR